jgi:PHD and RING finger domain-containing protein 1
MNTKRKRLARNIAPPQESSDDEIDTQNKRTRNPVNDVCPICLCSLRGLEYYAKPDTCDHRYCFDCLEEWSKTQNSCPSDRNPYSSIILKESATNQTVVEFHVEDRNQMDTPREEANDEPLHCAICNDCRRGDCMLCCSSCELGFHCKINICLIIFC